MDELARNPFNLALLADLLRDGVKATSLAKVVTRGELLERYWGVRVGGLGVAGTTSLKAVVDEMIGSRSIDLADTKVPIAAAPMVDELQRVGVLAKTSNIRIGFRHHVLFDYAVARLLLFADVEEALSQVLKDRGAGLLISPSVGYWLENLRRTSSAKVYWTVVARFVSDATVDPIVRVEIARLAVDAVETTDGISDLAAVLTDPNPALARALGYLVGALHTKTLAGEPIDRIIAKIEPTVRELPQRLGEPTPADLIAFRLFSEIADQLYYGVGHGEELPPWLKPPEAQRTYLDEHSALIIKLVTLGSPATVHHLIELVGKLVEANPELCFDIFSEAMLRTTGVAKYEHESMGATRFVELVGLYLADYRYLFDDDMRVEWMISVAGFSQGTAR